MSRRNTGFTSETKGLVDIRSGGLCERCGKARAEQKHHRRPRNSGGTRRPETNYASNCGDLCSPCHLEVESRRDQARVDGWLVPQTGDPSDTPVLYRGTWALLKDSGAVYAVEEPHAPCCCGLGPDRCFRCRLGSHSVCERPVAVGVDPNQAAG